MSNDTPLKPYPHQQETINKLNKEFRKGNTKQLVVLPSGSGKTHTIAFHVKQLKPKTFLYIVHRNEIVTQTIDLFKEAIPWLKDSDIGIINQENKDYDKPYLFATVQTISRINNINRLKRKKIDYVVIDEYHHVAAPSYEKILKSIKPKYLIGLTATPYRLDKKDIFSFVDNKIAHSIDLFEGISKKILAPFHYIGLHDDIDYTKIKFNGYQYNTGDLDRKLIIHKRDDAVIDEYFKKIDSDNRQSTIVFCNSVEHIKRMADRFNREGVKAAGIWHKQDTNEKRNIIELFRRGYFKVLLTRDILNEGVDFPECSSLMFLRPTISKTIFLQQLGRGLRKKEGKKDVLVLDFVGNYHKAFEKRHWFLSADSKIELKKYTGQYIKPVYEYDHPKPVIEFDSNVIEIMDLQDRYYRDFGSRSTTDEQELKDNYYHVKKVWLDRIRENNTNNNNNKNSNYHPPMDLLRDFRISKYSEHSYTDKYGTYLNFLREIGEIPDINHDLIIRKSDPKEIKTKKLLKLVKSLQKKLGRKFFTESDWIKEYGATGITFFTEEYGGIEALRKHLGIENGIKTKCTNCKKVFLYKWINKTNTKNAYCSRNCNNKHHNITRRGDRDKRLQIKIKCLYCDKEIHKHVYYKESHRAVTRKYCNRKCSINYRRKCKRQKLHQQKIINP